MKNTILVADANMEICSMITTLAINAYMDLIIERIFGNTEVMKNERKAEGKEI